MERYNSKIITDVGDVGISPSIVCKNGCTIWCKGCTGDCTSKCTGDCSGTCKGRCSLQVSRI